MPIYPGNLLPAMIARAVLGAYGLANLTTAVILILLYILKELKIIVL